MVLLSRRVNGKEENNGQMAMVAMMTYANTRLPRLRLTTISIKPGGMYTSGRVIAFVLNPLSDELESADLVDVVGEVHTLLSLSFSQSLSLTRHLCLRPGRTCRFLHYIGQMDSRANLTWYFQARKGPGQCGTLACSQQYLWRL